MTSIGDKSVIYAKYGEIIVDGEVIQEVSKSEIKVSLEYIDVEKANDLRKYRKLSGYEITGSITINKTNSKFGKLIEKIINDKYHPEINMQSILQDPAFNGSEAIAYYGITFDEIILSKIDSDKFEIELPFKAREFEYLESME